MDISWPFEIHIKLVTVILRQLDLDNLGRDTGPLCFGILEEPAVQFREIHSSYHIGLSRIYDWIYKRQVFLGIREERRSEKHRVNRDLVSIDKYEVAGFGGIYRARAIPYD